MADTSAVLQGLLQSYRPRLNYGFGGAIDDPTDQSDGIPSQGDLQSPFELEQARRAAAADAADRARIQGIRDTQQEAWKQGDIGATPQRVYSPGAAPPGSSPLWMTAGKDPVQKMAESRTALETAKVNQPLLVEQAKAQAEIDKQTHQYNMMKEMARMGAQGSEPAPPSPTPETAPSPGGPTPGPVAGGPKPEPSFKDIIFGGPTAAPGGTLKDLGGALGSYGKYLFGALPQDDPFSKATQLASFNNIKMIQATVPGSRGASQLLDKFAEHQAHVGREAPAGSDARLAEMIQMMQGVLQDINKEHYNMKMSPNGQLAFATDPAQLRNARVAAEGAIRDFTEARRNLRIRFPDLAQSDPQAGQPSPASQPTPGGRFSRVE
jgi:hypothetical protein